MNSDTLERKQEILGYCEICTGPLYTKGDTVLVWGPYPPNPSIGDVIISRRCKDIAMCAVQCSGVNWDKVESDCT